MGLKTNKATKTSKLNCQYVGSFAVKDGDRKMPVSEQNRFVDGKLKNCTKKLLNKKPVCLQVSPDGIEVLTSDEKTVQMAHPLRRVSYATVEPTNNLFAYVTHQPGTDMEIVCHTFFTKKRDHAEGLSAALGKLFKQTFAYTLKRRDRLEEAAQKRGANRRWAKQQVAEGHDAAVKNARNVKTRSIDVSDVAKENGVAPRAQQRPNHNTSSTENFVPPAEQKTNQKQPPTFDVDSRQRRRSPPLNGSTSSELDSPLPSAFATVHSAPNQPQPVSSPTSPVECETPFLPPKAKSMQPTSPFDNSQYTPTCPGMEETQPPALPSRPRPGTTSTLPVSPWANPVLPPELPSRNPPRRSSVPTSPETQIPPALPRRQSSDSSVGFGALEFSTSATRSDSGAERKLSAPDLMQAPKSHMSVKACHSSDTSIASSYRKFEDAAAVLLAGVDDTPPPLPRKGRQPGNQPPPEIPEEVIGPEEDEELRREVWDEPRVSLTLEDEDWYIPGVSREIVVELLETSDIGTFFVRDSQSRPGCYALTMKVIQGENNPTGVGNYLIAPEGDGFALQGFDKTFEDISSLIRHYASYDDGLPCRLVLAGSNPLFHDDNGYLVEFMDEENEKYASLSSCRSMFQELNMNDPW